MDYIAVVGQVTSFQGNLQWNLSRIRKAQEGEYNPSDYVPTSKRDLNEMYEELLGYINQIEHPYLAQLVKQFYVEDKDYMEAFKKHSAAKSVHHGFLGGLLEHTLGVLKVCVYMADTYPVIRKDLLLSYRY